MQPVSYPNRVAGSWLQTQLDQTERGIEKTEKRKESFQLFTDAEDRHGHRRAAYRLVNAPGEVSGADLSDRGRYEERCQNRNPPVRGMPSEAGTTVVLHTFVAGVGRFGLRGAQNLPHFLELF